MLPIFYQFLRRDLLIFKKEYLSKLFDTFFVFFTNVVVFAYFMGKQGLTENFGPFLMVGAISSFGLFEIVSKVSTLIGDIEGEKTISYLITMPLTSKAVFCYMGLYWALHSFLIAFPLFFLGKFLLFTRFDLGAVSYIRLIPMFITVNLFFGFFALWLSGMLKGLGDLTSIYLRYINPLFMFGAYFYTWKNAFELDHLIGYITLINPMVYVMEGMRSAMLGADGYIPFWICPLALWGFILVMGWHGIRRLQRRIDCI